jgi:hypothetical protein
MYVFMYVCIYLASYLSMQHSSNLSITCCDVTAGCRNSEAGIARQRAGKSVFMDTNTQQYSPSKLKLKLIYDRRSADQSVLVSGSHLEPITGFFFFCLTIEGFLMWGTLSDERMGL